MAPGDVQLLVSYIVGLVGDLISAIGSAITATAMDVDAMNALTVGLFGENGGLFYWLNEKNVWMIEQNLSGLTFNWPL